MKEQVTTPGTDTEVLDKREDTPPPDRPLHLILIDGSGFIFRAYHALPPMTRPDGTPVNAVFGFSNRLYEDYKAHRPPAPDDLIPQFALVREATSAFGVPSIELDDWEADDLIAAYAQAASGTGGQVTIGSSDKERNTPV